MKNLVLAIALVATSSAALAQQEWVQVAGNESREYTVKAGSILLSKNNAGKEIAVVTGRSVNLQDKSIRLEKWYVKTADCQREEGKISTTDLSGNFLYESDFVFGAGNIASVKAEFICEGYRYGRSKGITKGQ